MDLSLEAVFRAWCKWGLNLIICRYLHGPMAALTDLTLHWSMPLHFDSNARLSAPGLYALSC